MIYFYGHSWHYIPCMRAFFPVAGFHVPPYVRNAMLVGFGGGTVTHFPYMGLYEAHKNELFSSFSNTINPFKWHWAQKKQINLNEVRLFWWKILWLARDLYILFSIIIIIIRLHVFYTPHSVCFTQSDSSLDSSFRCVRLCQERTLSSTAVDFLIEFVRIEIMDKFWSKSISMRKSVQISIRPAPICRRTKSKGPFNFDLVATNWFPFPFFRIVAKRRFSSMSKCRIQVLNCVPDIADNDNWQHIHAAIHEKKNCHQLFLSCVPGWQIDT